MGVVLEEAVYAIRNVLFYFFVLFVLRVLLRNQWAAAIAFTAFWTIFNALGNDRAWVGALVGLLFFGTAAFVILRWGLLSFAVGTFVIVAVRRARHTGRLGVVLREHDASGHDRRRVGVVEFLHVGRWPDVGTQPWDRRWIRSLSSVLRSHATHEGHEDDTGGRTA